MRGSAQHAGPLAIYGCFLEFRRLPKDGFQPSPLGDRRTGAEPQAGQAHGARYIEWARTKRATHAAQSSFPVSVCSRGFEAAAATRPGAFGLGKRPERPAVRFSNRQHPVRPRSALESANFEPAGGLRWRSLVLARHARVRYLHCRIDLTDQQPTRKKSSTRNNTLQQPHQRFRRRDVRRMAGVDLVVAPVRVAPGARGERPEGIDR